MTTHDEAVMLVMKKMHEIDKAYNFMFQTMSIAPDWCATLPVTAEVKYADNYSK